MKSSKFRVSKVYDMGNTCSRVAAFGIWKRPLGAIQMMENLTPSQTKGQFGCYHRNMDLSRFDNTGAQAIKLILRSQQSTRGSGLEMTEKSIFIKKNITI